MQGWLGTTAGAHTVAVLPCVSAPCWVMLQVPMAPPHPLLRALLEAGASPFFLSGTETCIQRGLHLIWEKKNEIWLLLWKAQCFPVNFAAAPRTHTAPGAQHCHSVLQAQS